MVKGETIIKTKRSNFKWGDVLRTKKGGERRCGFFGYF
jgi:hypothetical protein